jgi:hypothetical protein
MKSRGDSAEDEAGQTFRAANIHLDADDKITIKEGGTMRPIISFQVAIGVLTLTGALYGCATQPAERESTADASAIATAPTPGVGKTTDLVFQYRQQAAELRDMARRLEMESMMYAQRQDQEQAKRTLDLAKDMRIAADTADEQARQYRRQVPHGQVY